MEQVMFRKLKKSYTPKMIAEAMQQAFGDPDDPSGHSDLCQGCGKARRGLGSSFCERCSTLPGAGAGDAEFHDDDLMSHERPRSGVDHDDLMPHERIIGEEGDDELDPEALRQGWEEGEQIVQGTQHERSGPSPEDLEAIETGDPEAGEDPRYQQSAMSPKERRIRELEEKYREHAAQEGEAGYQGW
jgi:hypothetical protein